jgi:ribosomal protein S18 acetylase RimI-like enzyme
MDPSVFIDTAPSEKDNDFIRKKLQEFNDRCTGVTATQYSVFAKEQGEILGGAVCYFHENSIYIALLWVDENRRASGIGSQILNQAEEEGIRRGAMYSTLDTFAFQAEGFYKKCGYERIGIIPSYLGQYDRIFLRKKLCLL